MNFIWNRRKCNYNPKKQYPTYGATTDRIQEFYENEPATSNASINNGDDTTSENTDVKIEQVFLHSESESELNPPVPSRDALSIFFQSVESQTRDLPIQLRLEAKRKISEIIFDLEERHINEMNQSN